MQQEHSIDKLTATWLLPVIAAIVTAATGANLCVVIPIGSTLTSTLLASYVLWGISVPMASTILVLYLHRLVVYKVYCYLDGREHLPCSFPQLTSVSVPFCQLVRWVKVELQL